MPFRSKFMSGVCAVISLALLGAGLSFSQGGAQGLAQASAGDPVSRFEKRLERGEATLEFSPGGGGYLPNILKEFGINVDSQVLVFSKTSLQQDHISPKNPRAIYFNDSVSVGTVPGGKLLELASLDPVRGIVFHILDVQESAAPRLKSKVEECTVCHNAVSTFGPGLMVATVYPAPDGSPIYLGAKSLFNTTDHRTPFEDRWGGWYVTGTHGSQHHMGNAVAVDASHPLDMEEAGTQNRVTLTDKIDVSHYLAPTSDLIALMTLEHQTQMTNLITSIAARSLAYNFKPSVKSDPSMTAAIDELVKYMLFTDEAPLREPVAGVSTFTKTFPRQGPRDHQGRSLRDFDLQRRLFRYPVSYMIYSESFDALPDPIREQILKRIFDFLTADQDAVRRAALEILVDTKQNLPEYWKTAASERSWTP
jgi:hypothetical protein